VALRVRTVEDWLIAIAAGQGIGLTAASTAQLHAHPGVVFVPVADAPAMPVLLGWRDGPGHPDRDAFVALALRVVRAVEPG
jgi:DNA-binding transcriptional LysR family regulator